MCFSTARLLRTRDAAIPVLLFPWAIWARTSRSRGVSAAEKSVRRDPSRRRARPQSSGRHGATVCDGLNGGEELLAVSQALLEQVSAAVRARLEQGQRVARLGVLAEHHHANARVGSRRSAATRIPSSLWDGGMRMSVTTTSGGSASIASSSDGRSAYAPMSSMFGCPASTCSRPSRTSRVSSAITTRIATSAR